MYVYSMRDTKTTKTNNMNTPQQKAFNTLTTDILHGGGFPVDTLKEMIEHNEKIMTADRLTNYMTEAFRTHVDNFGAIAPSTITTVLEFIKRDNGYDNVKGA